MSDSSGDSFGRPSSAVDGFKGGGRLGRVGLAGRFTADQKINIPQ